jgi:hypothetical protein
MRNPQKLFLLLIFLFISACSNKVEVSNADFGLFSGVGSKAIQFNPEKTFSRNLKNAHYGWHVSFKIKKYPKEITIREVIEAPIVMHWDFLPDAGIEISSDGKSISSTRTISVTDPELWFHNWQLEPKDPLGTFKAKLYIDGKQVSEKNFAIED